MALVAGIDSSTQSCKVVIRDAETGALFRSGSAPHPAGTEVDPDAWWTALRVAVDRAGGLTDVAALSVAGQQHGMVALDADGAVIRPALLWNDVRSADAAVELTRELGGGDGVAGAAAWAAQVGLVPRASFTVTKLRWLADHEPANAARVAAVALPHDWLTWRLAGGGPGAPQFDLLTTDRSDASGTGYFDAVTNRYRRDLLAAALHCDDARSAAIVLPRVLGPHDVAGHGASDAALGHLLLGPGLGDNAGAALALDLHPGETMLSLGTSGVAGTVALARANDPAGLVAGFADGTGRHLHLAVTLNAARILDATARVLRVELDTLSEMALRADPDAAGLVYVPYLEGERTPDLPTATGTLAGMTLESMTPENLARATVNALLCHMNDALAAIAAQRVTIEGVSLVGGGARSEAVRQIAPAILGVPVTVPAPGEYVADGAARQAAWVLSGAAEPPAWPRPDTRTYAATPRPDLVTAYRTAARRYTQAR